MSIIQEIRTAPERTFLSDYLETLSLVERLHGFSSTSSRTSSNGSAFSKSTPCRRFSSSTSGKNEVTAGELKTRGYYQGSNVSYNLKKLVDLGYMHHERCQIDRRSVRVRLTAKGRELRTILSALFSRHADILSRPERFGMERMIEVNGSLQRMERFWTDQIRYIY